MNVASFRARLRAAPVFPGPLPAFDGDTAPPEPLPLFVRWFDEAVLAGQLAAHAAVLSTAGPTGSPSGRAVILRDLDERGWRFATRAGSPKTRDLETNPVAALTFLWPVLGRQIRVSGPVARMSDADAAEDFSARSVASQATLLAGHQSQALASPEELDAAIAAARSALEAHSQAVSRHWSLYEIHATAVEFWQARPDGAHVRVLYEGSPRPGRSRWAKTRLWP